MHVTICKRQIKKVAAALTVVAVVALCLFFGQDVLVRFAGRYMERWSVSMIRQTVLALHQPEQDTDGLAQLVLGFDPERFATVIYHNILPLQWAKARVAAEPEQQEAPAEPKVVDPNAKPIKEISIAPATVNGYYAAEGVLVKNNTSYTFDPAALLNEKLNFTLTGDGPKILVVHSHASESYTPTDQNYYLPTDPDRTEDRNYNVVRVGKELADTLNSLGVETLHDTTLHDYPSYNGSYKNSLATVQSYLAKYPSIKIVIDVHRDAMVQADGTKLKLVADVNGEKAAQIMLLTGTNQGGLEHPNWQENLKFAMKLQRRLNLLYPKLTRPVSLTKERYNTHTTLASIIAEVGTTGNTLEEALVSARMLGKTLADLAQYIK